MSFDINVYVDDIRNASKADCERYIQQFGIITQIHPESNFETASGFWPFKMECTTHDFLKGKAFLSGFELFTDSYDYEQELHSIKELLLKKSSGIFSLFKKKTNTPAEDSKLYIVNPDVDKLLKDCRHIITMYLQSDDSFEPILALAFASYLVETCNGVIVYSHSDEYFDGNNIQEVFGQINEFLSELTSDTLVCTPFEEWL